MTVAEKIAHAERRIADLGIAARRPTIALAAAYYQQIAVAPTTSSVLPSTPSGGSAA